VVSFPSGFPTETLYTSLLSSIRATSPAHLTLLDFITRAILGEQYRSLSSSACIFLQFPVTSSLLKSGYYVQEHNKLNEDVKGVFCCIFFSKLHGENNKLHVVIIKLTYICEYVRSYYSWNLRRLHETMFYKLEAYYSWNLRRLHETMFYKLEAWNGKGANTWPPRSPDFTFPHSVFCLY